MDTDSRPPVGRSRLRLVDVRLDGDLGRVNFGSRLSGVLTATEDCSVAARWIATTVAGPRPSRSSGSIEVDGNVVAASSLPSPLLPAGASTVIDDRVIRSQWEALRLRVREELAAEHASCRLDSYRIDATLDQARERMWPALATSNGAPTSSVAERTLDEPAPVELASDDVPMAELSAVDWATPPDATTRVRAKIHALVVAYEAAQAEPLPEALLLADAWDAHAMLIRLREAVDALPADENIEALEARVNAARATAEMGAGEIPDDVRLRIEHCHREVAEAEAGLLKAKRRHRQAALASYEEAVSAELVALADAGIESYSSFLAVLAGGGVTADENARRVAEAELAEARDALDRARQVPDVPTRVELHEREALMRTRATELLGRAPGADPAEELRALRLGADGRDEAYAALAEELRAEGIGTTPDAVSSARAFLADAAPEERPSQPERKPASPPAPPAAAPTGAPTAVRPRPAPAHVVDPGLSREVADLEEQRWALDRRLARLEAQLAHVDELHASGAAQVEADDFVRTLESLVETYRDGDLLAGRLPLVIDGLLDGLSAETRAAAVEVFAAAEDVQTVVVTHDPEVMQSVARAGGSLARWPERAIAPYDDPASDNAALETSPTSGA